MSFQTGHQKEQEDFLTSSKIIISMDLQSFVLFGLINLSLSLSLLSLSLSPSFISLSLSCHPPFSFFFQKIESFFKQTKGKNTNRTIRNFFKRKAREKMGTKKDRRWSFLSLSFWQRIYFFCRWRSSFSIKPSIDLISLSLFFFCLLSFPIFLIQKKNKSFCEWNIFFILTFSKKVFIAYTSEGTKHLGFAEHETPFGKVVSGMKVVESFYDGYFMSLENQGPEQSRILQEGQNYLK